MQELTLEARAQKAKKRYHDSMYKMAVLHQQMQEIVEKNRQTLKDSKS